jgi:hypothetical protein
MRPLVQGFVSVLVGGYFGFAIAFILSPDTTGPLTIGVGAVLWVVLAVVCYAGISKATSSDSE